MRLSLGGCSAGLMPKTRKIPESKMSRNHSSAANSTLLFSRRMEADARGRRKPQKKSGGPGE
eukprot:5822135-Prymnesium_polylepis.1